jgi:nitrous oxidase accessory protein NosD
VNPTTIVTGSRHNRQPGDGTPAALAAPMHRITALASFALTLGLASAAAAADYYVASDGVDGPNGSQQDPWATLQFAAEQVSPGDVVHVAPGNYVGFQLATSGTRGAPITFSADPGATIDEGGPTGDGIRLQNVSFVTLEGFSIVGVSERGIAHRGATATSPVFGLVIRNNFVDSSDREGMYLSQVANSSIEGNTIVNSGSPGVFSTHGIYLANAGSDGTRLVGNTISGCGSAGIHFNGDWSVGGDGIISDLLVAGNVIFDNASNGLNMDGVQDSRIENNVVYGNGGNGLRAFVIDAVEGPKGLHIFNNTFTDNAGWGLRISDEGGGMIIANNLFGGGGGLAFKALPMGLLSDNNGVASGFSVDGDTVLSLEQWQALGFGGSSFTMDAAATFEAEGYALLAEALAVDGGVAMLGSAVAPSEDVLGVARPFGAGFDVGAYEYCEGDCGSTSSSGGGGSMGSGGGAAGGGGDGGVGSGAGGAGAGNPGDSADSGGCSLGAPADRSTGWILVLAGLAVGLRQRRDRRHVARR